MLAIKKIVGEKAYKGEENNGMFWLFGSQKFVMIKKHIRNIGGKSGFFNLLPLSTKEISGVDEDVFLPYIDVLKNKQNTKITENEIFQRIF